MTFFDAERGYEATEDEMSEEVPSPPGEANLIPASIDKWTCKGLQ